MIINFSELTIPFHRLAPGAVLISPDDVRYLKSIGEDMEDYWSTRRTCGLIKHTLMKS